MCGTKGIPYSFYWCSNIAAEIVVICNRRTVNFRLTQKHIQKMKYGLLFFLLLFLGSAALRAQPGCSLFFPFKEGAKLEYAYFDKQGRLESRAQSVVKALKPLPNGVAAMVVNTVFDKRDKEQFSGEYLVRCKNGVISIDVSSMLNPAMQQSFSNMEVTIKGEELTIPGAFEKGQELPDASTHIMAGADGVTIVDMMVNISDRKVVGKDTISTPAGVFDCYKLTQTTNVKMMLDKAFQSVEYYAEGVGLVRSETYGDNGEVEGYMELTAFEK